MPSGQERAVRLVKGARSEEKETLAEEACCTFLSSLRPYYANLSGFLLGSLTRLFSSI